MKRATTLLLAILGGIALFATAATAQTNAYQQTNLVSDQAGMANHTDPKLINPWGIAFFPGQPFWIADNNSGFSTLYDGSGNIDPLVVTVPPPAGSNAPATPTGIVANSTTGFLAGGTPSLFIFDTEDGTISGWNGGSSNAILEVDHSSSGAVYKGLALITNSTGTFLLATNFNSGRVEVYDNNFQASALAGSFTDPTIPANFAPFGIQTLSNGQVVVTYAMQDAAKHDPVDGAGNGFVALFDSDGNFVKRLASNGTLNSPWGVVIAPASFGGFANDLLIGNFGDGRINALDPNTGAFLGQLNDTAGNPISNSGLWAMVFGAGGTGDPSILYFTAGLAGETHGLFGALAVGASGGGGSPDFSLAASPTAATVVAGGSTNFSLSVSPLSGFTGQVSFSCAPMTGITCSFNPPMVDASSMASTTLTVTTSATVKGYGMLRHLSGLWLFPLGACVVGLAGIDDRRRKKMGILMLLAGALLLCTIGVSVGCGGGSSSGNRGTANVMVTATSGALSHTTSVAVTVK